jgi:aspartyl-tRNA(Asn)/glutamyl-tRNA(Gln) amidotransferase subunit A
LQREKPLRIAWYPETLESDKIDPEVKEQFKLLLESLKEKGHTVEEVRLTYLDYLVPTYYVLTTAEASSNLSRFSGVHFGYRDKEVAEVDAVISRSRSKGFGKEVKRRIMLGTFVLSAGFYDAYYTHAQKVRQKIRRDTLQVFDNFDIILTPTTPTTAFGIGEKSDDPIAMYLADIYTVQAPLAGIPAISVPLFRHSNGGAFGLQIMAAPFAESMLLSVTDYLQQHY